MPAKAKKVGTRSTPPTGVSHTAPRGRREGMETISGLRMLAS